MFITGVAKSEAVSLLRLPNLILFSDVIKYIKFIELFSKIILLVNSDKKKSL